MLTPQRRLAKSTPTYGEPVGVMTVSSVNGRNPRPASTTYAQAAQPTVGVVTIPVRPGHKDCGLPYGFARGQRRQQQWMSAVDAGMKQA